VQTISLYLVTHKYKLMAYFFLSPYDIVYYIHNYKVSLAKDATNYNH